MVDEPARSAVIAAYDLGGARALMGCSTIITDFAAELCEAPVALVTPGRGGRAALPRPHRDRPGRHAARDLVLRACDARRRRRWRCPTRPPTRASPTTRWSPASRTSASMPACRWSRRRGRGARRAVRARHRAAPERAERPPARGAGDARRPRSWRGCDDTPRRARAGGGRRRDARARSPTANCASARSPTPCRRWSGRRCPTAITITTTRAGTSSPACPTGSTDGEGWNGMFHPDDQARAWEVWRHSLATGEPYQIEYRLRHFDGTYRWVLGRALPIRDERGRDHALVRHLHRHPRAEARDWRSARSSARSCRHRIKNIFAVIAGLIAFAARARPEFAPIASDLRAADHRARPRARFRPPAQPPIRARGASRTACTGCSASCSRPISAPTATAFAVDGRRRRGRRPLGDAAGAAVPRAGDQRDQIWRAVDRATGVVTLDRRGRRATRSTLRWTEQRRPAGRAAPATPAASAAS